MPKTTIDTETLIDDVRHQVHGAPAALIKRFSPGVVTECKRYIKDPVTVIDAMHDVFVRFILQIDTFEYRGEKELIAFLKKQATWECLHRIEKEQTNPLHKANDIEASEYLEGTTADGAVVVREIMAVIAQLSSRCRQVLRMVLQGYEIKEIATYLGISETTGSRHLELARKKLADNPIIKEHRNGKE